ncbi:uncharacterized protein N7479_009337 [Penicillium vulpinum]|uniref:Zn(2)-C6 fungal-type domain-containing protein n=1 Tax=Penicillium vulpinum TaxID=29845 RepID=A0A1V6RUT1_9EURO|nr:uncharacterized protein N7479_009337 [Penicillium vulpinum]KAJ5950924.1 hypothetical protein N7479_009337 [Penicillium vulpinum]OQE05386.1 hypothetical protein PENVUL_c025G03357 [Penicillium vulpinum]
MVNTGKPSKGCENCRSRKIRCDQTRPAYWEGTQSNRECLGYRDETESVAAQKAHSFQSSSAPSTLSSSSRRRMPSRSSGTTKSYAGLEDPDFNFGSDRDHNLQMLQARQSPVQTHPNTTVSKQEAICFFLQSHAIPSKFVISEILINFLMDSSGSPGQRAIQSSIIAVASAMLSRVRKMPSLRQAALQEYGSTLNLVNQALANVEEAKTDQTLGAVVLLALYEVSIPLQPE